MEGWVAIGIGSLIFGFVGMLIADHKGSSKVAGFWLGFFLWPIGLIVAALLGPSSKTLQSTNPSQKNLSETGAELEADLTNAKYKVWLVEAYGIERNDVLGEYICGENGFKNIDDALDFAHSKELAKRAQAEEAKRQREVERQAEEEIMLERRTQEAARIRRLQKGLAISFVVLAVIAAPLIYQSVKDGRERTEAQEAAKIARASVILSEIGLSMDEMTSVHARFHEEGEAGCKAKSGVIYTFYTSGQVLESVRKMISDAGRTSVYSDTEGYVQDFVVDAPRHFNGFFTICDVGAEMPVA